MTLRDKVALITGAGRGIGEAIASLLAGAGARVIVNDLDESKAIKVADDLKGRGATAVALPADVTDEAQVAGLVRAGLDRFGRIDILVNNAALLILHQGVKALIWDMAVEEWDRVMAVNLRGTFLCTKHVLREMIKTSRPGRRIVNLSSGAAKLGGFASSSAYIASKAGIIGFTKITAREAAPYGVTVNAVAPGMVDAPMMRLSTPPERDAEAAKAVPLGRLASPREIAEAVLFLASDAAAYITGATLDVNGGWVMD
ncbi:MAG: 3-oxoacyl-ACP reductase family protein [Thermodesulfobacteriota bacterium]